MRDSERERISSKCGERAGLGGRELLNGKGREGGREGMPRATNSRPWVMIVSPAVNVTSLKASAIVERSYALREPRRSTPLRKPS